MSPQVAFGEQSVLKVYSYFNSICTQKVFITLAEKGIDYATQNVERTSLVGPVPRR